MNELGYEEQSCRAVEEWIHNVEDAEAPGEGKSFRQQKVAMLTTKGVCALCMQEMKRR